MNKAQRRGIGLVGSACAALLAGTGCATPKNPVAPVPGALAAAAHVLPSADFAPVGGSSGIVLSVARGADFARYDAVLLDIAVLWSPAGSEPGVSMQDGRTVTRFVYAAVESELRDYLDAVDRAGPGVLLLRVAISRAGTGLQPGNFVTAANSVPETEIQLGTLAEPSATFLRQAYLEATVTDGENNELLIASVSPISSLLQTAKDGSLQSALLEWARGFREGLVEVLKAAGCPGVIETGTTAGNP